MKRLKKHILLCIAIMNIVFNFSDIIVAETNYSEISGIVLSSENKPIFRAHVAIPAINRGTITDENGKFTISHLPNGKHRIVISYIGYQTNIQVVDLKSNENNKLKIILQSAQIQTEPVIITGSPHAVNPLDTPQDISSLSGRNKMKYEASSIGKTLEELPGVYNISAGSVAGKPVIHGHTGERVLILSDGVAQEYQQYGERHSPTLESFNYDRIEVIKGAASLLYGSDAIGGAVNLIPHPLHFSCDRSFNLSGNFASAYLSNNNEYMAGLKLYSSFDNFAINASLVRRKADNFNAPDVDSYSKTLKRGDPKFTGEIPNTNFEQFSYNAGVGYLTNFGIISVDYDYFLTKNNFLLPTGLPIGLRLENQILNLKTNIPISNFVIKPKFSYQQNHRQATPAGMPYSTLPNSAAVDLKLNVYTGRIEVEHVDLFGLSGTFGTEIKHYDHDNIGKVPLQPTGYFTNYSLFIFEEWVANRLTLNFGGRFDYRDQLFYGTTTNPLLTKDDSRNYSNFSGALGAAYKITNQLTITGNIGRGFRTPSFFNLYVYGEHGGVFAFQIGNPALKDETSLDLSTSLRFNNSFINGAVTLFHNIVNNYIYLYSAPEHPLAPAGQAFVFAHAQADAALTGFEANINVLPFNWLVIDGTFSSISSKFTSGVHEDDELPLMPPTKGTVGVKFLMPSFSFFNNPYFGVNSKFVLSKNAAGIYEPFGQFDDGIGPDIPFGVCSTDKYSVIDLSLGFDILFIAKQINIDFQVTNLLDNDYRDFLDTYKGYALAPGRSFNLKLNIAF